MDNGFWVWVCRDFAWRGWIRVGEFKFTLGSLGWQIFGGIFLRRCRMLLRRGSHLETSRGRFFCCLSEFWLSTFFEFCPIQDLYISSVSLFFSFFGCRGFAKRLLGEGLLFGCRGRCGLCGHRAFVWGHWQPACASRFSFWLFCLFVSTLRRMMKLGFLRDAICILRVFYSHRGQR